MALATILLIAAPVTSHAVTSQVKGGVTSVVFGNGASDAGAGNLGPNSVSLAIDSRNEDGVSAGHYLRLWFGVVRTFSGAIEHTGRIQSNGAVDVGDFTIKAASDRRDGASGFLIEITFSVNAILFDIAQPIIETFENSLVIAADTLVSPELTDFLGNCALAVKMLEWPLLMRVRQRFRYLQLSGCLALVCWACLVSLAEVRKRLIAAPSGAVTVNEYQPISGNRRRLPRTGLAFSTG